MVTRTPPLTIGLIGTGETSVKNIEAQLTDFTSTYAEVTAVLPVDDEHWTETLASAYDWIVANDIPFVAVTDGSSSKALAEILDKADSTIKVSRVSVKIVQLLKEEKAEGDVALLVAWDDDDSEANIAVTKALDSQVQALNLLNGLDPFEYGDDEGESHAHGLPDDAGDTQPAELPSDDYDSWGIRKLRATLRERSDEHDIPDRTIGTLEVKDAARALRNCDKGQAGAKSDLPAQTLKGYREADGAVDPDNIPMALDPALEADEAQTETRTTRARRAFAEGASEGQDETRPLPASKGSDIIETEDDKPTSVEVVDKGITGTTINLGDEYLREKALSLAIQGGKNGTEAVADAMKYEVYLKGERQSGGRPRADGTPAQPREINEDGKPVRRRRASSTE